MAEVSKLRTNPSMTPGIKMRPKTPEPTKVQQYQQQQDEAMYIDPKKVKNKDLSILDPNTGQMAEYVTQPGGIDPAMLKMKREQKFGSASRGLDMERGRATGREIFEDQLGRVEEPRSQAMADLLGQRKQQMDEGLGAGAFQAAREQRLRGLQGQNQMQNRNLAAMQAQSGIRGGAAAGQLAQLMGQQQHARQGAEQDLLLADANLKQGLMDKYGTQLGQVEAGEAERERFNIGQVGKEKFGELATGLSEGQMGVAERTGVRQAEAAKAMQAAMSQAGGGGSSGCCSILAITAFGLGGADSAKAQDIVIGSKTDKVSIIEKYQNDSEAMESIDILGRVRFVRDNHTTTKQLRGYYKFSELTVPYIKKSPTLSKLGYKLMVQPVADHSIVGKLWIKFWGFFGNDKPFVRSNGEIV